MERWGKAWKDIFFSHNKRISRPVDIVFTVYLGTKLLLNMMEAEGLAKFNIDVFVTILGVIGIIISYFIVRFSPNQKELFHNFEHRIVWMITCLLLIVICCLPLILLL